MTRNKLPRPLPEDARLEALQQTGLLESWNGTAFSARWSLQRRETLPVPAAQQDSRFSHSSLVKNAGNGPVEALMFCLGDGRTMMHDTKVGELWGHAVDKWPHVIFRRAHQNAREAIDRGDDALRVVCDRAHENGMLLYPTLLVQLESGERGKGGYAPVSNP